MAKRTITISKQNRGKLLHVEAPGCSINIRVGSRDAEGREVTAIEILPDRSRFAGEVWTIADDRRAVAMNVRVVRETPTLKERDA